MTDQDDVLYEEKSDRAMMRQLPPEDRAKIQTQVEEFRMEKVSAVDNTSKISYDLRILCINLVVHVFACQENT